MKKQEYYFSIILKVAQYIGETCRYILAVNDKSQMNNTVRAMFGNGLRPQIWKNFVDRFGVKEIYEFYGATEGNSNLGKMLLNHFCNNSYKITFCLKFQ